MRALNEFDFVKSHKEIISALDCTDKTRNGDREKSHHLKTSPFQNGGLFLSHILPWDKFNRKKLFYEGLALLFCSTIFYLCHRVGGST